MSWHLYKPVVTVVDVLDVGACIDGVNDFVLAHGVIAGNAADYPDEPWIKRASYGDGNGYGDSYGYGDGNGYGDSYGYGDGDGNGYGDSYGYGDGNGYGDSYGYGDGNGYGYGDGDGLG